MTILNLGCGFAKLPGAINVDKEAACDPDQVVDLEATPWPFEAGCAAKVIMRHVLEHLGQRTDTFLCIMRELYRVLQVGGTCEITVPHPRSDAFLNDPTHVRAIMPGTLAMFSKRLNREWIEKGWPNTPLGIYCDIDFELIKTNFVISPKHSARIDNARGQAQKGAAGVEVTRWLEERNNISHEIGMVLQKVGPA